jgi:hypothetical protein
MGLSGVFCPPERWGGSSHDINHHYSKVDEEPHARQRFQEICRSSLVSEPCVPRHLQIDCDLGSQKGVFKDFTSWEELMSCSPQPLGSPIRLKESTYTTPVFAISSGGIEGVGPSNEQSWTYHSLQSITTGSVSND